MLLPLNYVYFEYLCSIIHFSCASDNVDTVYSPSCAGRFMDMKSFYYVQTSKKCKKNITGCKRRKTSCDFRFKMLHVAWSEFYWIYGWVWASKPSLPLIPHTQRHVKLSRLSLYMCLIDYIHDLRAIIF